MNPEIERLRRKYIDNPSERMTSEDIRCISKDDLPDMDYFLNEDNPFSSDFGEDRFYIFKNNTVCFVHPKRIITKHIFGECMFLFIPQKSGFL